MGIMDVSNMGMITSILESDTREAAEMRKILARMIKSELKWVKENRNQKVCKRCEDLKIS